jgi:uncharacterized membrane protein YccC
MGKIIGSLMIAAPFVWVFIMGVIHLSLLEAAVIFGVVAFVVLWVVVAVYLVARQL